MPRCLFVAKPLWNPLRILLSNERKYVLLIQKIKLFVQAHINENI